MNRLVAASPKVVVPGHGDVGGAQRLADVRDYLELLRDETWVRRDSCHERGDDRRRGHGADD